MLKFTTIEIAMFQSPKKNKHLPVVAATRRSLYRVELFLKLDLRSI